MAEQVDIGSKELNAAIGRVWHAVADEEARPILTCILFEGDADGLRLVAADNYRIAIVDVAEGDFTAIGRINLPRAQVTILRAFLAKYKREVIVSHDGSKLTATDGTDTVTLRLMDGMFPNYRAAITEVPVARSGVTVNPQYLIDAMKALKGALTGTRIELPDAALQTIYVKADGYSEWIMPIRAEGAVVGSAVEKAVA